MASDKNNQEQVVHVEAGAAQQKHDGQIVLGHHDFDLDADELRDQIAAQMKLHKLSFTSAASLQLLFYFFIAYCSEFSLREFCVFAGPLIKPFVRLLGDRI